MNTRLTSHIFIALGMLGAGWLLGASAMPFASNSAVTLPTRVQNPVHVAVNNPEPLEVVNPTLASLELRFDPNSHPAESTPIELLHRRAHGRTTTSASSEIIDAPASAVSLEESNRPVQTDAIPFNWIDTTRPGSVETGWADGYGRSAMPIPGLNWRTDWNSTFSVQLSHQTWRESTDIAVLGMFSIDF